MPSYKCKTNIHAGKGKRYLKGSVVELDEKTAALNSNFVLVTTAATAPAPTTKAKKAAPAPEASAPAATEKKMGG